MMIIFVEMAFKIHVLVTMQKVVYMLHTLFPVNYTGDESYTQLENDYICRGMIVDAVNSSKLFDLCWNYQTAEKLQRASKRDA